MPWQDLLQTKENPLITAPWVGGHTIQTYERSWQLKGRRPREHGWHTFKLENRKAHWLEATDAPMGVLKDHIRGTLGCDP